jgi:hypothetical protein
MTKKRDQQPARWKGDEVEHKAGDAAEEAATRAEGNGPVRADEEARRLHAPGGDDHPEPERRRARGSEDPEDEISDVAEEHRERQQTDGYPPRGKL